MRRLFASVLCLILLLGTIPTQAQAAPSLAPTLDSLSASTLSRSGRLVITGQGLGGGTRSVLKIGGKRAWVTQWSDREIHAYVPEKAPVGAVTVQVITPQGSSNTLPLTVTLRQADGRVQWRFQADGMYFWQRPAVGADGTIYANDVGGNLYALSPTGGLKWLVKAGSAFAPVTLGADGTIYVADMSIVTAVNPNGTIKWRFTDPGIGQGVIAGPNVGPDGNIYVVNDIGGLGAFALSPSGELLWNDPGFSQGGQLGQEIVFGSGQAYFGFNMNGTGTQGTLFGYTLDGNQAFATWLNIDPGQPAVGPQGTIYAKNGGTLGAFDDDGNLIWSYGDSFDNYQSAPDVAVDGSIYVTKYVSQLHAVDPTGQRRWTFNVNHNVATGPIASPTGDMVVLSGNNFGAPGSIKAISKRGTLLWEVPLPQENGGFIWPGSRARFNANGSMVYLGMTGNSYAADPYTYLYAVSTAP